MPISPFVKRLATRIAFLASVLFALGLWPQALIAATYDAPGTGQLEDDDEVAVAQVRVEQSAREARTNRRRARLTVAPLPSWAASLTAPPFAPRQRVERGPTLVLYKPFLRLRC